QARQPCQARLEHVPPAQDRQALPPQRIERAEGVGVRVGARGGFVHGWWSGGGQEKEAAIVLRQDTRPERARQTKFRSRKRQRRNPSEPEASATDQTRTVAHASGSDGGQPLLSSTARTLRAKASWVNGLARTLASHSRIPWSTTASSA